MAFKINDLTSKFSDFLRPNLYAVYIFPKSNFADYEDYGIGLLCNQASFPFYTFTTVNAWYNNKQNYLINKIDYDPITFSFFVDKFNKTLKFFDLWRKQIIDDDHKIGFYDDYISFIDIEIIDGNGETAAIATLENAFPINIESIPLSYDANDQIINMSVSFQFNNIIYDFVDRAKQQKIKTSIETPSNLLSKIRQGVNMVSKIKNYGYMIQNANAYDIVTNSNTAFNRLSSNSGGNDMIGNASKMFK